MYTPELEVHSYVYLFPKSFGSFISWYHAFRPIARNLQKSLRTDLEKILAHDPILSHFCHKIEIQSRLKTPSSAFKKMFQGAKLRNELYDIIGFRAIVEEKPFTESNVRSGFVSRSTFEKLMKMWFPTNSGERSAGQSDSATVSSKDYTAKVGSRFVWVDDDSEEPMSDDSDYLDVKSKDEARLHSSGTYDDYVVAAAQFDDSRGEYTISVENLVVWRLYFLLRYYNRSKI